MADTVALLKRPELIYLIEMRLPQTYMPPRLTRQPMAALRSIVRRAIRDGNLPADRVYQLAQFVPGLDTAAVAGHIKSGWLPGDPRCDSCDNGLHADWLYCPYCGEATALGDKHGPAAQMLDRINALEDALRAVRVKALPAGAAVGLQREGWEDRCREVLDIIDAVLPSKGEG